MKNLLLLLVVVLVSSCGHTTPIIGSEKYPFIVVKIQYYNETHSKYVGVGNADNNTFSIMEPAIILPTGIFNIGDIIPTQNFIK
jgi:hypothetical protein